MVKIRIRLFGLDDSDLQKEPGSTGGFMELGWSDRGLQWSAICSSGRHLARMRATVVFSGEPSIFHEATVSFRRAPVALEGHHTLVFIKTLGSLEGRHRGWLELRDLQKGAGCSRWAPLRLGGTIVVFIGAPSVLGKAAVVFAKRDFSGSRGAPLTLDGATVVVSGGLVALEGRHRSCMGRLWSSAGRH